MSTEVTSIPTTPPRRTRRRDVRSSKASSTADVCVVGGGSPAARPRCISPSAATAWCCSRVAASAGVRPAAAAARRSSDSRPARTSSSNRSGSMPRGGCGTSRSKRSSCSKERIARHSIDCDLHWGQMHVAIKPRHVDELKAWQQETDRARTAIPARAGSSATRYGSGSRRTATSAGCTTRRSGHLHPLNYTLGLAAAAEAAGVRIFENSQVTRIDRADPASVATATGRVRARHVAICCNA